MKKGFTLLELLSVMAIMGIVSTIAIMGYFAVMRGASARSAAEHLSQTIMLARQSAIMQGKKVYVVFDQDLTNSWYSVCRYDGVITSCYGEWIVDDYADWSDKRFEGATMYNLSVVPPRSGKVLEAQVVNNMLKVSNDGSGGLLFNAVHQAYGWEIYPPVSLPRGMQFGKNIMTAPPPLVFNPDGSAQSGADLEIYEQVKISGAPSCIISVDSFGRVDIDLEP